MTPQLKEYIQKWLTIAEHDLLNTTTVIEHQPLILDTACFHCQQAAEKFLKAFLIFKGQDIAKTHNIKFLLEESAKIDSDFSEIDIKNLNDFAIDIRYPDDYLMPDLDETKEYLQIALDIKKLVLKKIKLD